MRNCWQSSLLFVLFLFGVVCLQSQSLYRNWKINLLVSGNYSSGNVNKRDYSSTFDIVHKDSAFEYNTNIKILYSFVDSLLKNKQISINQTLDYKPFHRFSPFMALTYFSNEFKGYKFKGGGYIGAKCTFVRNKVFNISISEAFVYEHESYVVDKNGAQKPDKEVFRFSTRFKYVQNIGENVKLSFIVFHQPMFADLGDYLVDIETKLQVRIFKSLNFNTVYTLNYNSKPPYERISKYDHLLVVGISFKKEF